MNEENLKPNSERLGQVRVGGKAMDKLKIEYVPINSINPYENNAKLHPKEQIEQIKKSMQEFGNIDPIGVWHNEIVEGHGRFQAAKELGIDIVPVIRLDELTDEQRKAYALIHNKLTMNSDFDLDILSDELDKIFDIDMSDFGFESDFDEKEEIKKEEGEVLFTEELLLTHNYIVLYFDNDFDWEVAQDKFGLEQVKDLIPRKGQPKGVGRVINGKKVLTWQS